MLITSTTTIIVVIIIMTIITTTTIISGTGYPPTSVVTLPCRGLSITDESFTIDSNNNDNGNKGSRDSTSEWDENDDSLGLLRRGRIQAG